MKNTDQYLSITNLDEKFFNKVLAKRIRQYIKIIIYHNQVGFIPKFKASLT